MGMGVDVGVALVVRVLYVPVSLGNAVAVAAHASFGVTFEGRKSTP